MMEWVATAAGAARSAPDHRTVPLSGLLLRGGARPAPALFLFLRPPAAWQLMPIEATAAARGLDLLCAGTRFARNEALAVLEESLLDVAAWIRFAKRELGYGKVVLLGWSGSGTLAAVYQAQALRPTITHLPWGAAFDLASADLIPADALTFHGAHAARARLLAEAIDPSVIDEADPTRRDPALDLYAPDAPRPPYDADFLARYRQAQRARIAQLTAKARARIEAGRPDPFVVARTMADPHFLDPAIDPNGRVPDRCWLGPPSEVNVAPGGIARVATPEAWLSQWSIETSQADAIAAAGTITCPLLVIENGADDAVPPAQVRRVYEKAASADRTYALIEGATHSYAGQPGRLDQAIGVMHDWARERELA